MSLLKITQHKIITQCFKTLSVWLLSLYCLPLRGFSQIWTTSGVCWNATSWISSPGCLPQNMRLWDPDICICEKLQSSNKLKKKIGMKQKSYSAGYFWNCLIKSYVQVIFLASTYFWVEGAVYEGVLGQDRRREGGGGE